MSPRHTRRALVSLRRQPISNGPREAESGGVAAVGDEEQPEGGVPVDVDKEPEGAHAKRRDGELLERRVRWEAQVEERREERVERLALLEHRLLVRERLERVLAVVRAHAARADAAEGKIAVGHVHEAVVDVEGA
eukprot:scaffold104368_cov75-Phaeocystis_antarctica.AAC.2